MGGAGGSGIFIVRYSTTSSFIASFDSQGGSAISNVSTASGGSLADPGTPTKAGYTFKGWFTAATGGSPIAFPYAHSQNADFTLFAQWNVVVVDSPSAAASNPVRTTETSNKSLAKTGASTFDYQLIFFGMFSLILGIQLIRRKPSSR